MSTLRQITARHVREAGPGSHVRSLPSITFGLSWARFLMPSLLDVLFVVLLCATVGFLGPLLLSDSDIGWHIRNGDHILFTHAVPQQDYFSYTMPGRTWYAWEWLYDVIVSVIHGAAGLNGVVLLSACIFALTIALLFRFALKTSGSLPVAIILTLFSTAACSIHLLARPHLVTWLITIVWFQSLDSYQRGERKNLLLLPVIMLLWVNLHGGFLIGLSLTCLFLAGSLWTFFSCNGAEPAVRATVRLRHLSLILALSLAATLLNPYGTRLYSHLYRYLGNSFLMDSISEFLSPNFHLLQLKAFALLLIAAVVALSLNQARTRMLDLLIVVFAFWSGLYATRNIPIAAILLTPTIAPMLATAVRRVQDDKDVKSWLRELASTVDRFSTRMGAMELRSKGHAIPTLALALLVSTVGSLGSHKETALHFDPKIMPVEAADYMSAHNIHDHFFSPDDWGGYLIYRLYPDVHLMVDDRHDFYGEAFMRDYLNTIHAGPGWSKMLDAQNVTWVLIPHDCPLASVLRASDAWEVEHEGHTALLFARKPHSPVNTDRQASTRLQKVWPIPEPRIEGE